MPKVPEVLYSRPPLERMHRIFHLLKDGDFPNCVELAKEFEVSTRTIKRDIDFMKVRYQLPIEYDARRYGYYFTGPVEEFPSVPVTEAEMFALFVAQKAVNQYRGTSFGEPLEAAFRKLTSQLSSDATFTLNNLDQALSFRPFAPGDTDVDTFQKLTRALQDRRGVCFLYRNLGAERAQKRTVHPYHLACIDSHWYLFAHDAKRNAMRTFVLTRLRDLVVTNKKFTVSAKFDAGEHLKGSMSVFKGTDDYEVVVDFDRWAADLVRGRRWHATQNITELPKGQMRMSMRLNSIEEAERWILGWGIHATVVRPKALAKRIRQTSSSLLDRYDSLLAEPRVTAESPGGVGSNY